VYLCDVSSAFGDKSPDYSPERLAFSLELMKKRRSFYKKVFAENFQNSIDKYGMKYMTRMVKDVMLATTGAEPTAIQMLEAKHHTYGIFGLEHDWISGALDISTQELAESLYDHTPDYLKVASKKYSFRSDEILSNAGK